MTKTNATKFEEFLAAVTNAYPNEVKNTKNANEVIQGVYNEFGNYSTAYSIKFAKDALKSAKENESATLQEGIIFGAREAGEKGTGPVTYGLLQLKKGKEIQAWRGEFTTGGRNFKVPTAAAVQIQLSAKEDDYGIKYEIKNIPQKMTMTVDEIMSKLVEWGAITALSDVTKLIKKTTPPPVIAVKATIAGITPMSKYGKPDEKYPIWSETRDKEGNVIASGPHLSIRTRSEDGAFAWIRVFAPKTGKGITPILVEDFSEMCKDAKERFSNPQDQATFLATALDGNKILVIGSVNKILEDDEEEKTTINMKALALLEDTAEATPVIQGQQPLVKDEQVVEEVPEAQINVVTKEVPETTTEEVPETTTEEVPETIVEEVPETVPETAPKTIPETEWTPKMKELKDNMLFMAGVSAGTKDVNQQKEELKKMPFGGVINMGASKKHKNIEMIATVYTAITGIPVTKEEIEAAKNPK